MVPTAYVAGREGHSGRSSSTYIGLENHFFYLAMRLMHGLTWNGMEYLAIAAQSFAIVVVAVRF